MKCLAFKNQSLVIDNSISEVQANTFERSQPGLDGQKIIVSRGRFVEEPGFDNGKDDILLLPFEKCWSELAEEFSARDFQHVKVTRVIDVIAQRAFRVRNPV